MNTLGRTARAMAALAVILGLLIGVPVTLWHVGRQLLDGRSLLGAGPVASPLEVLLRPDDGTLLIAFLVAVGAAAWLMLTASLVAELVAVATRRPGMRLSAPGFHWSSGVAAALVSAVVGAGPAMAVPAMAADITFLAVDTPPRADPAPADPTPSGAAPEHVVVRRDTLWRIAETTLGDPLRWREIYDLNAGRDQPDGGRLTEASILAIGWRLVLPDDAQPAVRVEPGDTLTGLAQEHLGDPALAGSLFDHNRSVPQPDGGALTDPDLIRPGWTLVLPSPTAATDVDQPAPRGPDGAVAPPLDYPSVDESRRNGATTVVPTPGPATGSAAAPTADPALDDAENGTVPDDASPAGDPTEHGAAPPGGDNPGDGPGWAVAAAGMSTLVAGGVAVALALHRRRQLRHRPARHRIVLPGDDDGRAEWSLQNPAPEAEHIRTAARRLDLALRCLTSPGARPGPPLAAIRTIRLTDTDALITTTGDGGLPEPFTRTAEPHVWTLDADQPLPLDEETASGLCAPYPTVVSVGTDGPRTLLIDLEERRLLRLGGDTERCVAALRHMAAELATSATAEDTEILLVGLDDALAALNPEQVVVTDLSAAMTEIDHRARATRAALHRHHLDSVTEGRRRNLASDSWLPTVLLLAHPVDEDERTLLDALDLADSAVAVVALDEVDPDLFIDGSGTLHLDDVTDKPWAAVALTAHAGTHLATLLGTTSEPAEPVRPLDHPGPWATGMDEDGGLTELDGRPDGSTDDGEWSFDARTPDEDTGHEAETDAEPACADEDDVDPECDAGTGTGPVDAVLVPEPRAPEPDIGHADGEPVVDLQARRRLAVVDYQDPALDDDLAAWISPSTPLVPMVAILGEPTVRAPGSPPATRSSWFTEVLVYLSLHPSGVTTEVAAADLWTDGHRISPATVRHAFYGARRWAGRGLNGDPDGSFVSDMQHDSAYRLRGHLLDWDLVRRLRKRAEARAAAAHPGAVTDYEAALALIRGPVLSALRPGGYAWLNNHDQRHDLQIPGFLVDTAHELVDIALAAGDTATARRAAEQARGLDIDVVFDRPLTDLMRIAHAEDNRSELELYAAVLLDARGFDVPEELAPDSFAVLNELLPRGPRRPGK